MINAAPARGSANSLVGGTKSSTPENIRAVLDSIEQAEQEADWLDYYAQVAAQDNVEPETAHTQEQEADWLDYYAQVAAQDNVEPETAHTQEQEAGRYVQLSCEQWRAIERDEDTGAPYTPLEPERAQWMATVTVETVGKQEPPRQQGDRITERLSQRAKKAIEYSSKYAWRMGKGYRTFLTLTFDEESRRELALHDHLGAFERPTPLTHGPYIPMKMRESIGSRVTKFLNVLQQRYRNGLTFTGHYRRAGKQNRKGPRWTPVKWREGFRIRAHHRPFWFVWVIENPTNEAGESNPHVHIMLNWGVKLDQFHAWSRWIEKTWGYGFAKLEKLKKPEAAANYMAKAAHYLGKGADGSQGIVRGNRYAVARDARPPASRRLGKYFADWLMDAVRVGQEAEREKIPKGLFFHKWGFGATTREAWGRIWKTLKADGWRWKEAGPPVLVQRVRSIFPRMLAEAAGWFAPKPAEYWDAVIADGEPGWLQ